MIEDGKEYIYKGVTVCPTASDIAFVEEKHNELVKNHGIMRLEPMGGKQRKVIHFLVRQYDDMTSFSIDERENKHIVLRYCVPKNEVDYKTLIHLGKNAYFAGDYEGCLKYFGEILEESDFPRDFIYFRMGMCYQKLGDLEKAIDYLIVAQEVAKKFYKENVYDYSKLITRLQRVLDTKTKGKNTRATFTEDEYKEPVEPIDKDRLYEIANFAVSNNLNIEDACEKLNMSLEERDIAKLLCAIEYYKQGDTNMGDLYYNTVTKTKNKTENVKRLLKQINERKRFYQNDNDSSKRLVYIKPGKRKM